MTEVRVEALRMTRVVRAEPQAVWDAWTRPEQMKAWSCPVPGGLQSVSADVRVGGDFLIQMVVDGNEHTAFGTYREVEEPRRLVYTWDWREEDDAMGETTVCVEFRAVEGGTEIVLVHDGFPVEDAKEGHAEGWAACLVHLQTHLD